MTIANKTDEFLYRIGGTLSADEPSYVTRDGDEELYRGLKKRDFCYVLNSRQMGKSSLAMRVLDRLESDGMITAYIDLQGTRTDEEKWYNNLILELDDELSDYLSSEQKKQWLEESQSLSAPQKFGNFLEKVVLASSEIQAVGLVIFIDEIDYVRTLDFSTDSFFTLIRSCYNARARKPNYEAITFCLLGVATPSDLIDEKHITPFNIGEAISLKGFTIKEVEPLIKGLKNHLENPREMMIKILDWTGGQPFLTQRLCDLVVSQDSPNPDLNELVQYNIIDNWDDPDQDKQEHLRTIRNRILSHEQSVGLLLELYREVLTKGRINVNNSREERALQLSGLVVKRGGMIEVYNRIYEAVFNEEWVDAELAKLRPYSENYKAWLASGKTDQSRLLRGEALSKAEKWFEGKNLGGEDREFLSASRGKEREEEAIKIEKDILEKANQTLEIANKKAKRKIGIGTSILWGMVCVAGILGIWVWQAKQERDNIKANIKVAHNLSQLAGELQQKGYPKPYEDALQQAGLSLTFEDPQLKQALSWSGISLAYQYLGQRPYEEGDKPISQIKYSAEQIEYWHQAEDAIYKALELLKNENLQSQEGMTIAFFTYSVLGTLLEEHELAKQKLQQNLISDKLPNNVPQTSLESYQKAINILRDNNSKNLSLPLPSNLFPQKIVKDKISDIYYLLYEHFSSTQITEQKKENSLIRDRETFKYLSELVSAIFEKHTNFLIGDLPSNNNSRFVCGTYDGQPTTIIKTPQGFKPFIQYRTTSFGLSLSPQTRCLKTTRNLNIAYANNEDFLTIGRKNGYDVICSAKTANGDCQRIIITVPRGKNAAAYLNTLRNRFYGRTSAVLIS